MPRSYAALLAIVFVGCSTSEHAPPVSGTDAGGVVSDATSDTGRGDTADDASSDAVTEADVALDALESDADADGAPVDAGADADAADGGDGGDGGDAGKVCHPALTTSALGTTCKPVIQSWEDEGHAHVLPMDVPSPMYCTRPPSSGDHYGDWADFQVYDKPVPYGNLVHSLEHGAVVLLYRCPTAMLPCKTTQSALVKIADAQPVDPLCTAPLKRRIIVAPDPSLDIAIGAAAWQWTYRAECVDDKSLGDFITAHYAMATENFCSPGIDPTM